MTFMGATSIDLQVSGSDGVMKLTGGSSAVTRSLSISGSDDVTIYATGSAVYTMPPSSSTLLGDVTEQYMTNKSGSFVHLEIPVVSGAPTNTPSSQSVSIPVVYDTANDLLYAYNNGTWQRIPPSGLVSSSGQISYTGITDVPAGLVSSSTQVDYDQLQNLPTGLVSSSSQISYTGITDVPSGIVSSSAQVVSAVAGQQIAPAGATGSFTGSFAGTISGHDESKSFTIADPAADDNIALFYTDRAITITEVADVISGATSVTWNISYATTRDNGTPTDLFSADRTTSTTSGATTTTFANPSIPAGRWVWYAASALSSTPTQLHITLKYRVD